LKPATPRVRSSGVP